MPFVFARDKKKPFSIAPTEWCPQQNKQANGRRSAVRSFRAPPSSCVRMCIHACLVYVEGRRGGERLQVRIDTIECYDLSKPHKHTETCVCVCVCVCVCAWTIKGILATLQYTFCCVRINPCDIWGPANIYTVYVLGNMKIKLRGRGVLPLPTFSVIAQPFKNAWAP